MPFANNPSELRGDYLITGSLSVAGGISDVGAEVIKDSNVSAEVGDRIDATKLIHQFSVNYSQDYGAVVVDKRSGIYIALAAGEINAVLAALSLACAGAATVTVDIKKNGTTVLTGLITFNSGVANFGVVTGAISVVPYIAGDVFEVIVDATVGGGTLGQGLTVCLVLRENPN